MKCRLLLLAGSCAISAFLSVVLGTSVAEGTPQASQTDAVYGMHPAIKGQSSKSPVSSLRKRKRVLLAQTTSSKQTTPLLAIADQPTFTANHKKLSDAVLRALPPHCRTYLKNYYIQYSGAKNRGLGGKTTIILDGSVPDKEFVGLLVHECAHVTHANMLGSSTSEFSTFKDGKETFRQDSPMVSFFSISWTSERILKKGTTKEDFVSGYAKADAFEDFAETFAAYVLQRPMLRERAKTNAAIASKLEWMETHLPLAENIFGESTYVWNKTVPWDVTKLPYVMAKL